MVEKPRLPTVDELKALRRPLRNINQVYEEKLSRLERLTKGVTERVGSVGFFLIIMTWSALWLAWNALAPKPMRFDPFPAFVLWLFISNLIQILLMPLIMVGQNLQGRHAEARAESDYEVNVMAEREIEAILRHLEIQGEKIEHILQAMQEKKPG